MSYYEKGMGAALVAECNKEKLTFHGGTGLLAIQLRDTCLFADAAAERIAALEARCRDENNEFKNFHRVLCERFGYVHDEIDWRRDQLSLIEHIASAVETKGTKS